MSTKTANACPCGSNQCYAACCGLYISGLAYPSTPEALMRSRYTAYTLANIDYISNTMTGPAAIGFDPIAAKKWAKSLRWVRLEVLSSSIQGDKGEVSFKAYFTLKNKPQIMMERSIFEQIKGRWFYTDTSRGAL